MIAVKTTACCLSGLSFCEGKACSGSQFLQLLVQQVLLVLCCFACKAGYQHLKLTCFATPRGPLTVSFTMALVCCTVEHFSAALFQCESTAVFSGTSSALQRLSVADIPPVSCVSCLAVLSRTDTLVELCECKRCRKVQVSVLGEDFCRKL